MVKRPVVAGLRIFKLPPVSDELHTRVTPLACVFHEDIGGSPPSMYSIAGRRRVARRGVLLYADRDTLYEMRLFNLNPASGQALYTQLSEQIRHAVETGTLRQGDALPGIRTLAEQLVVSPNTVAKAYSELEHQGIIEMRHGSGAFICVNRRTRLLTGQISVARTRLGDVIKELRGVGLHDDEIRRAFEVELLAPAHSMRKR
jgi:GntR family transcriptional regulator